MAGSGDTRHEVLTRLTGLRLHQHQGRRAPHKPLLVLLALARLAEYGSSELSWSTTHERLSDLLTEFGPASRTGRTQSAAYPFTRLRTDGVWLLDRDVPMDLVTPLTERDPSGRLAPELEAALRRDPALLHTVARTLVESHFPATVAPDVLLAAGLDPDVVLAAGTAAGTTRGRRRNPRWRGAVLAAWDRQCAFCGYDGQLGSASAGLDAAHVRWFAYDGPDELDNGLALCVLHHKLFDLGVVGLDRALRIEVSDTFTARTPAGRAVYELHGREVHPRRPGHTGPAAEHITWHRREVFKGTPLAATAR
ncbi:restriction endonuclease [Micromonospora echinospora]|uniref:Putative restriction endonuclease n=1 Tax=Micromonospora echinospora TaxID=1877 RepID=A0A1C4V1F9_MICEC|nr:HNH endonuclease [Micromonospora echinospora]OZV82996.1 restriction endonuclease [Micromonospora echinospora]SCE77651.1 putative restriction endonuclease [Micromonospora echinospora]